MKLLLENWRRFTSLNEAINPATIEKIEAALTQGGGETYIVGGAVRDEMMPGAPSPKDIDFLVRKLPLYNIASILAPMGSVKEVGRAFGVVTAVIDGEEFDFAIPRTAELKTGKKHTDFNVTTDPNAPIEADLGRRDFTINALAKDSEGNVIDHYGGLQDIQDRVIRAVGDPHHRFSEDPLRMLRALQFATRFDFNIEPNTADAIRSNLDKLNTVAAERIFLEFEKAWTKGAANSNRLISLLGETGVGTHIFGKDFNPREINLPQAQETNQKIVSNAIAFFVDGGNYAAMKPTNEIIKHIELAKQAASGQEVYIYGADSRVQLPLVSMVLNQIGYTEASEKIEKALTNNKSNKYFFGKNFNILKAENGFIQYQDELGEMLLPKPNLLGDHQLGNISTVIAASRKLFNVKDEDIKKGITKIELKGRLQEITSGRLKNIVGQNRLIIEGGHNIGASMAIANWIKKQNQNVHLIVGMMKDKDHQGFINCLKDIVKSITLIDIPNQEGSISKEEFKNKLNGINQEIYLANSIEESIKSVSKNKNSLCLIAGSLYLAAEVLNIN